LRGARGRQYLAPVSIRAETLNGVRILEIDRPGKKNALTLAMYDALTDQLNAAGGDPSIRAVLITGQPGVFTSGNDLQDFMQNPPDTEDSSVVRFMRALLACEKPVIAAVTGTAIGIGVTMLLHCDLVYVSADARLAMPFVTLALVPEFAVSLLLPRLIGHVQAAERLLLGEPFTGAEAVAMGIANASLPAADVFLHARRIAERFNALPPEAVRETKRLMRAPMKESIGSAIGAENAAFYRRLRSPEAKEAFEAFFRKDSRGPQSPGG
jgi:enoyl-CoA hydratase/carnithine racemase